MKIKIAIIESDKLYLDRIVNVFTNKLADKLETYSFTNKEMALNGLGMTKVDVVLADPALEIVPDDIPYHCGFAYLVERADVEEHSGQAAICKYQKVDLLYKEILNVFSDNLSAGTGIRMDSSGSSKILGFVSASGGAGCSTAAAAAAMRAARLGKKVLYLDLDPLGCVEEFFQGAGQGSFSDVIFAVKSKKANASLKLESTVRQDSTGVYFYASAKSPLDVQELSLEDYEYLLEMVSSVGGYDCIILDMKLSLDKDTLLFLNALHQVIFVLDGRTSSNARFQRCYEAVSIMENQLNIRLLLKSGVLYNRFSNKRCRVLTGLEMNDIGGIPRIEGATSRQLLERISIMDMMDEIL